jgi:hypothetical protein
MTEALPGILIGVAAIIVVLVMAWLMRKTTSGEITPLAVHQLVEKHERHISLLEEQNTALRKEREFDRAELLDLIKKGTEGLKSVYLFMDRYEALGGMVMADRQRELNIRTQKEEKI